MWIKTYFDHRTFVSFLGDRIQTFSQQMPIDLFRIFNMWSVRVLQQRFSVRHWLDMWQVSNPQTQPCVCTGVCACTDIHAFLSNNLLGASTGCPKVSPVLTTPQVQVIHTVPETGSSFLHPHWGGTPNQSSHLPHLETQSRNLKVILNPSNTLATWCEELTHLKRPRWWERLRSGGEEDDRGWDGWMASLTR